MGVLTHSAVENRMPCRKERTTLLEQYDEPITTEEAMRNQRTVSVCGLRKEVIGGENRTETSYGFNSQRETKLYSEQEDGSHALENIQSVKRVQKH